jgi:Carboxypeptidase regulatory-like domain
MSTFGRVVVALVGVLLWPAGVYAQASLAGTVRDSSGAVLPGVTVEAASPVLIEKVRTAVTDGGGLYQITELRPGDYTVTFTLPGFNTIKREGVQLSGNQIATLNADMRVGGLEETITVTGDAPTVDVQSTTRQQVITRDVINTIPTGRNYTSLGQLITGVSTNTPDQGGALGDPMASLTVHGSRTTDQRVMQNGVNTMTLQAGGNIGIAVPNPGIASEVTIDTASVSAEQPVGGVRINYIPRDGGNQLQGSMFFTFANEDTQANNLTQRLKDKGLTLANSVKKLWDVNPGVGGPIRQDKLWFWFTGRYNGAHNYAAGMFANKNAYNPNVWVYEADTSQPGANLNVWADAQIRLTSQVAEKHKVAFTWDQQTRCSCPGGPGPTGVTALRSPEAAGFFRSATQRLLHAEWTSPVTNRLLLEVVGLHRTERWGFNHPQNAFRSDFISPEETDLLAQMIPVSEQSTGLSYRSRPSYNDTWVPNFFYRFTASYVTGTHAFKTGLTEVIGFHDQTEYTYHPPVEYRLNLGVPNLITQRAFPIRYKSDLNSDLGVFVQDRWSLGKMTATMGLRFDYFRSGFPEQTVGPSPLTPNRNLTFPASKNIDWKDITPRLGVTYDPFGDGKTAVKASLNKYLASQTLDNIGREPNPVLRLVNTASRRWDDRAGLGINGDYIPQCDLLNPLANGECFPLDNLNFGLPSTSFIQFSDELLTGWGNRNYNWEFTAGVQREIVPRVSADVSYFRRWYGNFRLTDNTALTADDFDQFSIPAPTTAGLPTTGTITGLYDVKPGKFGQTVNLTTLSRDYGEQIEHFNGVDVNVNARLSGALVSGGMSTGKWTRDNCEVARAVPEYSIFIDVATGLAPVGPQVRVPLQWCHQESPFLTQVKLFGSYIIPVVDVLISGSFLSTPGPELRANYNAPNSVIFPSLGRNLAGNLPNQTVTVIEPLKHFGERLNQLDVRFGKVIRVGRARTTVNFDVFNVFNSDTVLTENPNFGAYRRPTGIPQARFLKIGATLDF